MSDSAEFIDSHTVYVPDRITGFSKLIDSLIVLTDPLHLYIISNCGEILTMIDFTVRVDSKVRKFHHYPCFSIIVFENGNTFKISLKQFDILQPQPLDLQHLPFTNVYDMLMTADQKYYIILFKNGDLLLSLIDAPEQTYALFSKVEFFTLSEDTKFILAITSRGYACAWNIQAFTGTKMKLPLVFTNIHKIIYIPDYFQVYCVQYETLEVIDYAVTEAHMQTSIYHTYNSIIVPSNGFVIDGPTDLINHGLIIHHAAASNDMKYIAIAGKKGFVVYQKDKQMWVLSADRFNNCRCLWFQSNFFVCVAANDKNQFKILLLNPYTLEIVDSVILANQYTYVSYRENRFSIITEKTIFIYQIHNSHIREIAQYPALPSIKCACLTHEPRSIAIITGNEQLLIYPCKVIKRDHVQYLFCSEDSEYFFYISKGKLNVYIDDDNSVELEKTAMTSEGLNVLRMPRVMKQGQFQFEQISYLPPIFMHYITKTEEMTKLLNSFIRCEGFLYTLVDTLALALEQKQFNRFLVFLEKNEIIKDHVLVLGLIELNSKYKSMLLEHLPPKQELLAKFPKMAKELAPILE